mmetsp:Transcript_19589/g.32338  ORF Transcript_19589/g.32338 Transcript_19589/m.32338 type:complete len:376 (+) Transcript_19589:66-1193(+)
MDKSPPPSSSKKGVSLSRLLSFLDLFKSFEKAKENADSTGSFSVKDLGFLAKEFYTEAKEDITTIAKEELKVELREEKGHVELIGEGNKKLTNAQVCKLVEGTEAQLDKAGLFDYDGTMQMVLEGCRRKLEELLQGSIKDISKVLQEIKVNSIQGSGADFMVQYEVGFMASSAEKTISYPNIDKLGEAHVKFIMENYQLGRKSQGRTRRDVFFWCFDRTCHEITHIVQGLAEQKDKNAYSMSAEHDASIGAYSLLWAISKDPKLKAIFPPGFASEVLLKTVADDLQSSSKWDEKVEKEYTTWVDSFGCEAPSNKTCEDNVLASSFCGRLSSDYFTKDDKELAKIFSLLFKDRTGDVYAKKISPPKSIFRGIKRLV